MNGAQHTPGPWRSEALGGRNFYVLSPSGHVLAEIPRDRSYRHLAESHAKLIAASVELLAYAKCEEARSRGEDIAETVLRQHGWTPSAGTSHDFMDRLRRAAIAKATGSAA